MCVWGGGMQVLLIEILYRVSMGIVNFVERGKKDSEGERMKGERKESERAVCENSGERQTEQRMGKNFPPAPHEREAFTSFSP